MNESALTPELSVLLCAQDGRIEVKKAAGNLNLINGVRNRIYVNSLNTGNDISINVFSNFSAVDKNE